jgi:hypothetical protein
LRQTFAAVAFDAEAEPKHFTAGFGLAAYSGDPPDMDADQFLAQADIALHIAQRKGRNRVAAYWELDHDALPSIPPAKRHARVNRRQRTNFAYIGLPEEESHGAKPAAQSSSRQTSR